MEQKSFKIDIKNFLKIVVLLYAVLLLVGVLTYIIPGGQYALKENGEIIPDSFEFIESATRLPWYRWLTAPFEGAVLGDGNFQMLQIIAIILLLGGCFKVLEASGGLKSLIRFLISKFRKRRFAAIFVITLLMMALSSLFGLQEELLILFPIFMSLASSMGWSKETALGFVLITSGTGFTAAILNPFTIGICCELAGISITDGIWYRVAIFAVLFVLSALFLVHMARTDEKKSPGEISKVQNAVVLEKRELYQTAMVLGLFGFVLLTVLVCSVVPPLQSLGMVVMALAFLLGTVVIGRMLIGSFKLWGKAFGKGVLSVLPSVFIIMAAFSIKYIADEGNILHTIFYFFNRFVQGTSPYLAVIILYLFVLLVEFFIPSASAKALLIIPLLTLAPIPGISKPVIALAYLFGDGYTNVLFPTNSLLMIGLGVADIGYFSWLKRTALFQALLFVLSCGFLMLAVFLGL